MPAEENIIKQLKEKFSIADDKIKTTRQRRIFLEVEAGDFRKVFDFALKQLKFVKLCAITGLDENEKLAVLYHLAQDEGVILNIKISVPKEKPVIKTITDKFSVADAYERELVDLFGIDVEGLKPGFRYPLPDGWPAGQYPLRKDWKPEVKNGK